MDETFFDRVELRLKITKQSAEGASKRSGAGRDLIRDIRRKRSIPNSKNLIGLAAALECSSEYLLCLTNDPGKPPNADGSDIEEFQAKEDERLLILIYRSLPDDDKQWLWQQVLREAKKAGISVDGAESHQP